MNGHHPRPQRHGLIPASHVRSWRAIITARGSRPPIVSRQVLNGRHHPRHPSVTASSQRRGRSCLGFTSSHSCRECLSGEDSSARKKRISSSHPKKKKTPTKSAQENSPARIRRRPLVATMNATSCRGYIVRPPYESSSETARMQVCIKIIHYQHCRRPTMLDAALMQQPSALPLSQSLT